jgi:hypothetical protein
LGKYCPDNLLSLCRKLRAEGGGLTKQAEKHLIEFLQQKTADAMDLKDDSLAVAVILTGVAKLQGAQGSLRKVVAQNGEGDNWKMVCLTAAHYLSLMGVTDSAIDACVEKLMGLSQNSDMMEILGS